MTVRLAAAVCAKDDMSDLGRHARLKKTPCKRFMRCSALSVIDSLCQVRKFGLERHAQSTNGASWLCILVQGHCSWCGTAPAQSLRPFWMTASVCWTRMQSVQATSIASASCDLSTTRLMMQSSRIIVSRKQAAATRLRRGLVRRIVQLQITMDIVECKMGKWKQSCTVAMAVARVCPACHRLS